MLTESVVCNVELLHARRPRPSMEVRSAQRMRKRPPRLGQQCELAAEERGLTARRREQACVAEADAESRRDPPSS